MKVLEHLACVWEDCSKEAKELYWAILYDCAKSIKAHLKEYSCGYVPVDPFDEGDDSVQDVIQGIKDNRN